MSNKELRKPDHTELLLMKAHQNLKNIIDHLSGKRRDNEYTINSLQSENKELTAKIRAERPIFEQLAKDIENRGWKYNKFQDRWDDARK